MIREDAIFLCVPLVVGSRGPPPKIFENQECRRSHFRSFFKAIKLSDLPELCLFAAVSEEEVPIYFFLLNVFEHKIEVIMALQIYREVPMWILRIRLRQRS